MKTLPGVQPDVSFQIPSGVVHLTRMKRHERFTQIRRGGSFGWTLGPENLLTSEIAERLGTDVAGAVAAQLLGRASLTWQLAPHVKILHDPGDVERLQRTPDLIAAADEIAGVLRQEIDADAIIAEANEKVDAPFLYRAPYAVHMGRRLKSDPGRPERYFGRLAPLGATNLRTVIPSLGFVPARALTSWPSCRFMGWPLTESRLLKVEDPHIDLWVQPKYRARDAATEIVAVTDEIEAARRAPDASPVIALECDDVIVCRPLRTLFAPGLKLVMPDGQGSAVTRPVPLKGLSLLREVLDGLGQGEKVNQIDKQWWVLCPCRPSELARLLPGNDALVHALVWVADQESDVSFDPWAFTDADERGVPSRSDRVRWYEFDPATFAAAVGQAVAQALPEAAAVDETTRLVAACRRAASMLREELEPNLSAHHGDAAAELLTAAADLREKLQSVSRDMFETDGRSGRGAE